jgi:hypothetical protein
MFGALGAFVKSHRHLRALVRHHPRSRSADSIAAARNHCDLPLQRFALRLRHVSPPSPAYIFSTLQRLFYPAGQFRRTVPSHRSASWREIRDSAATKPCPSGEQCMLFARFYVRALNPTNDA